MRKNVFKTCALVGIIALFAVMTVPSRASAQPVTATFSEQELDQMLAPIALYPDSLLAQILIAATYPDQVMEADRWLKANPGLKGNALNDALDRMDWDLSVKALAPFPQVLDMMAQERGWTQRLGEAFLIQQADVMDSVQRLRRKAEAAGNLRTTAQQRVVARADYIEIEPVNPEIVYVPRYNPLVVYGPWWWPAYPPFAYYPVWPGVVAAPVGVFGFWGAVAVGPAWGWGWGSWGWARHSVFLNVNRNININSRNVRSVRHIRRGFRTTSLRHAVRTGRFGGRSATWKAARTRVTHRGPGRTGVKRPGPGRTGVGARPGRTGVHRRGHGRRPGAESVRRGLEGRGVRGTGGRPAGKSMRRGRQGTRGAGQAPASVRQQRRGGPGVRGAPQAPSSVRERRRGGSGRRGLTTPHRGERRSTERDKGKRQR